jgi:ribosomal-protein-alanine N-acetyltransferase
MQAITTARLVLEPLTVGHANDMFELLSDSALYRYLDYPTPASLEHLRSVYSRLEGGKSPDGSQLWLNWVVRLHGHIPLGYVQATVADQTAWVAYVLSRKHWGCGYAEEATRAMLEHLASFYGVVRYQASVESENQRSIRLLERLAFHTATAAEQEGHDFSKTERLFIGYSSSTQNVL